MADQRSLLRAIRDLTGDRIQRYVTIDAVAEHLGIEPDDAERMALRLDDAGMVRVGGGHSVTLVPDGRQLVKKPAGPGPSIRSGKARARTAAGEAEAHLTWNGPPHGGCGNPRESGPGA